MVFVVFSLSIFYMAVSCGKIYYSKSESARIKKSATFYCSMIGFVLCYSRRTMSCGKITHKTIFMCIHLICYYGRVIVKKAHSKCLYVLFENCSKTFCLITLICFILLMKYGQFSKKGGSSIQFCYCMTGSYGRIFFQTIFILIYNYHIITSKRTNQINCSKCSCLLFNCPKMVHITTVIFCIWLGTNGQFSRDLLYCSFSILLLACRNLSFSKVMHCQTIFKCIDHIFCYWKVIFQSNQSKFYI